MPNIIPSWEVTLNVYGPITIDRRFAFEQRKDFHFNDRLYSEIEIIKNGYYGITLNLTAYATQQNLAKKAALYFSGHALDVLSSRIDLPIFVSQFETKPVSPKVERERRVVTAPEWNDAFHTARLWLLTEPTFLRAIGWYRKGLCTEDPFDKFLAFFNTIETLAAKYNPNKEQCAGRGSKCHIWETFKAVWGNCTNWPIISNQIRWIDESYTMRKDIAHGIASIDINVIENVVEKLDIIKEVANRLITDWERLQLRPVITDEIHDKLL